ncbi:MAG: YdbL family protein [Nanoarchaeota archaeon]|nr:YdbL family protein [Nanoarchaeota archaeon]
MKEFFVGVAVLFIGLGCARVRVEAPKEPIKVDISMRLDIYQHVAKDIDAIEDLVTGAGSSKSAGSRNLFTGILIGTAYAQEGLSPEVEQAALRRRDRRSDLVSWEARGVIGENKLGLVEVRKSDMADSTVTQLVGAENNDRMIIYKAIAQKNGASLDEVQKMYAEKIQETVPQGTPVEVVSGGGYEWKVK